MPLSLPLYLFFIPSFTSFISFLYLRCLSNQFLGGPTQPPLQPCFCCLWALTLPQLPNSSQNHLHDDKQNPSLSPAGLWWHIGLLHRIPKPVPVPYTAHRSHSPSSRSVRALPAHPSVPRAALPAPQDAGTAQRAGTAHSAAGMRRKVPQPPGPAAARARGDGGAGHRPELSPGCPTGSARSRTSPQRPAQAAGPVLSHLASALLTMEKRP